MLTITDFILARVREEEELAHAALDHLGPELNWDAASVGEHFDRWNPWRVESACIGRRLLLKAHRDAGPALVDLPGKAHELLTATCATCGRSSERPEPWPCYTIRVLALEWANHPDYWTEWRPVSAAHERMRGSDTDRQERSRKPGPGAGPSVASSGWRLSI